MGWDGEDYQHMERVYNNNSGQRKWRVYHDDNQSYNWSADRLIFDNVKTWAGSEWLSRSLIITGEVTGGGAQRRSLFMMLMSDQGGRGETSSWSAGVTQLSTI